MATQKLIFSLNLRHDSWKLAEITKELGFKVEAGWDRGEQKRKLDGSPREGIYDESYRSYTLGEYVGINIDDGISRCLPKLEPVAGTLQKVVTSGGVAIFAVGWFFNSTADGDRISSQTLARISMLGLELDLYLYCSPESDALAKAGGG